MKREIKRIGLFSAIKTMFVLGGVGGFMLGIMQWMMLLMIQRAGETLPGGLSGFNQPGMAELMDAGIGALGIVLPFFGGFAGAIFGTIFAVILCGVYNIAARLWGGLEFELSEATTTSPTLPLNLQPTQPGQATPLPQPGAQFPTQARTPSTDSERRPPAMYE